MADNIISQVVSGQGNILVGQAGGSVTVTVTVTVNNGPTRAPPLRAGSIPGLAGRELPPSMLVHPRFTPVPVVGREGLIADLVGWATDTIGEPVSVRVLGGQGGAGKTRLGLVMCAEALAVGWVAGLLAEDYDLTQMEALMSCPVPRLVVVDCAETLAPQVEQLLTLALETGGGVPLRVLFLVRHGRARPDGRLDLGASAGDVTGILCHSAPPPILLDDHALPVQDRRALFDTAVERVRWPTGAGTGTGAGPPNLHRAPDGPDRGVRGRPQHTRRPSRYPRTGGAHRGALGPRTPLLAEHPRQWPRSRLQDPGRHHLVPRPR